VLRVQVTAERAGDGARLADEIIAALATVTRDHATAVQPDAPPGLTETGPGGHTSSLRICPPHHRQREAPAMTEHQDDVQDDEQAPEQQDEVQHQENAHWNAAD
jgi:hypothetical protein